MNVDKPEIRDIDKISKEELLAERWLRIPDGFEEEAKRFKGVRKDARVAGLKAIRRKKRKESRTTRRRNRR